MTHDVRGVATMVQRATTSSPDPYVDSTWSFGHDAAGRMTSADGPVRDLTYDYDGRGRLAEVADAALGAFSMGYDLSDRLTQLSRPNGAVTAIGYDGSDRVGTMNTVASGNPVHTLSYGYDSRGYPASMTDAYGTTTYTHDTRGRLTGADHPATSPVPDESYTYDGAYRRLSWVGNPTTEVVYNDGDQLIQDATYAYAYDQEGQRTERIDRSTLEAVTYDWNSLGELVGITTPTGTWRFDYDALGRRTLVEGPGGFTRTFAYDTNDLARVVYDGSGTVVASYVTGTGFGEVLAEERGGTVRYAVRDKLGTPVAWLGSGGGVDTLVPRDAYGRRVGGDPTDVVPYGYTGHAEDPTGLVWGRARYLDTAIGGWLSKDPVGTEARYAYVAGAPAAVVDPTGSVAVGARIVASFGVCAAVGVGAFASGWSADSYNLLYLRQEYLGSRAGRSSKNPFSPEFKSLTLDSSSKHSFYAGVAMSGCFAMMWGPNTAAKSAGMAAMFHGMFAYHDPGDVWLPSSLPDDVRFVFRKFFPTVSSLVVGARVRELTSQRRKALYGY